MHELSVMMEVIRIVDETAKENKLDSLKAVVLQVGEGNFQARWAPVDNGDQRRAVAFASGGDSEQLAVGIAGHAGRSAKISR